MNAIEVHSTIKEIQEHKLQAAIHREESKRLQLKLVKFAAENRLYQSLRVDTRKLEKEMRLVKIVD